MVDSGAHSLPWRPRIQQDIDLIREIMLRVESTKALTERPDFSFEDQPDDHVAFNIRLLINAGYLEGTAQGRADGSFLVHVSHLTMAGFDFLDTIRDDSVFDAVKDTIRANGLNIAMLHFKLIAEIGLAELRQRLGGS